MPDISDRKLIELCRGGDRAAQRELVERHQRPVFQVALRILGSREDAADVAQTSFLKVFERLGQYDPEQRLFSWVYRIAVNEAIDHLKRSRRHDELPEDMLSTAAGPEDHADNGRLSRALQNGLSSIPDDYRIVLVLRHFSDCSYEEIAVIVGVPEKTVKSRLYGARQMLKERLLAEGVTLP